MSRSKIRVESFDPGNKVLKVIPSETFDFNIDADLMHQTVLNLLKIKNIKVLLDLQNIAYPTTSFIGFMVEVSSTLRRQGGEFIVLNLTETARMNFVTFSPLSFLNIVDNESELQELVEQKPKEIVNPNQELSETNKDNFDLDDQTFDEEFSIKDIVTGQSVSEKKEIPTNVEPANFDFAELVDDKTTPIKEIKSEKIVIKGREDQLYKLTDFVAIHAEQSGFDSTEISRIKISVYEAGHNIIEHAYKFDSNKFIELSLKYDSLKFTINLMDKGESFDYDPSRDYNALEAAEERRNGGFGLHIIRRSMDDVRYETNPIWGNRLILVKNIP
jgi:serine/threonine-protein kinase RsbW